MTPDKPLVPKPPPTGEPSEFERTKELMRRLLRVPKQALKEDKSRKTKE
jgi:hypothetical protein